MEIALKKEQPTQTSDSWLWWFRVQLVWMVTLGSGWGSSDHPENHGEMPFRSYNQPKMVNCLYDFAATQNLIQKHQALVIQLHSDKLTLAMENPHLSLVNTIMFFLICYGYASKIIEIYYTTAAKTQYVPSFQAPWLLARQKRHVSVGGFKAMATLLTFNELIRHRNTQQRSSSAESQKTWESLNKFALLDAIGLQ